jgi:preprotein translocase subunit YajC
LKENLLEILEILAQTTTTPPTTQPQGQQPPALFQFFNTFGFLILIMVIFYFLVIRSKQKTERTRQQMLSSLKKGDEVQTIGGVLGKVIEARDDRVLVKVDESSNTKMWFTRGAIHRVISEEKSETK